MDEMYRMLGREHEADLEREAAKWRRADRAARRPRDDSPAPDDRPKRRARLGLARLAAFVGRAQRVEA